MEIEMEYSDIVIYSIVAIFIVFFVVKRTKKYKKGVIVANSKYVKNTKLYKQLLLKYKVYKLLTVVLMIVIVMSCAFLLARTKMVYRIGVKKNVLIYIEDAMNTGLAKNAGYLYDWLLEIVDETDEYYLYGKEKNPNYLPPEDRVNMYSLIKKESFDKVRNIVNKLKDENISIVYRNNPSRCYECICKSHPQDKLCKFEEESYIPIILAKGAETNHDGKDYYYDDKMKFDFDSRFPIVLSSFTDNITYTNSILDNIMELNDYNVNFYVEEIFKKKKGSLSEITKEIVSKSPPLNPKSYITDHFLSWGNIISFHTVPGLPPGFAFNYGVEVHLAYRTEYGMNNRKKIANLYRSDKYSNKLSYMDFINERFERFSDNVDDTKYVIWYTDINKDLNETTSDILNREKEYCDENNIKVLSVDMMSEDEIVNTIKSSKKMDLIKGTKKNDASNIFVILITISIVCLYVLDWRIKV